MSHPDEDTSPASIPTWALQRANEELHDTTNVEVITQRARDIAGESRQLEAERHDEFDDPDQGGEA